jgi:intracellular sulfur oxidation DsrE/DsrF family protein
MSSQQPFSDEFLNAFVDNELTTEEKSRVYTHINQDDALNRRVCELRKVHDLVQLAYRDLPQPPGTAPEQHKRRTLSHGVAAGLVFMLGVLVSWMQFGASAPPALDMTAAVPSNATREPSATNHRPLVAANGSVQEMKVLFHLNSGEPNHIKEVLDEAENLIQLYQSQGQAARVEIVANGKGLNLLLAGRSPYPERVVRMQRQYSNLTFVACHNTMEKFNDLGIKTQLLPGATVIDSGVAQIIRLQQQGWLYIQV